jgi:ParB-like chromosome segregation protein Spo0J
MNLIGQAIASQVQDLFAQLDALPFEERVETINEIRMALHERSPFVREPVDCVLWLPADLVEANDYNPNTVAPPEMRLLEHSIAEDGYTQPVVTWVGQDGREVVDGLHRCRVGKESPAVRKRAKGYLPVTTVNQDRTERCDRIAATIRHNRARGKHQIAAMSEIVVELSRRNWSDARIAKELGMDADEVLRLKQISGLAELFSDREFSEAWEVRDA